MDHNIYIVDLRNKFKTYFLQINVFIINASVGLWRVTTNHFLKWIIIIREKNQDRFEVYHCGVY